MGNRHYYETDPTEREMRLKHKAKVLAAQRAAKRAVENGELIRPDRCSNPACNKLCIPHGHHKCYDMPLRVEWLCDECHSKRHTEMNAAAAMALPKLSLVPTVRATGAPDARNGRGNYCGKWRCPAVYRIRATY
jgi:hypothetical protein